MMVPYPYLHVYEISGKMSDSRNFFKEDFICRSDFFTHSAARSPDFEGGVKKRGSG